MDGRKGLKRLGGKGGGVGGTRRRETRLLARNVKLLSEEGQPGPSSASDPRAVDLVKEEGLESEVLKVADVMGDRTLPGGSSERGRGTDKKESMLDMSVSTPAKMGNPQSRPKRLSWDVVPETVELGPLQQTKLEQPDKTVNESVGGIILPVIEQEAGSSAAEDTAEPSGSGGSSQEMSTGLPMPPPSPSVFSTLQQEPSGREQLQNRNTWGAVRGYGWRGTGTPVGREWRRRGPARRGRGRRWGEGAKLDFRYLD